MFNQHPLIPFILLFFTLILVIKQCLNKHKFFKFRFMFVMLLIFICTLILFFYNQLKESTYLETVNYVLLALEAINTLFLFFTFNSSYAKDKYQEFLISTLDQTKFFILLDKKDRIKEASTLFVNDLGLEFNELYDLNFFDAIEKKYRIVGMNQTECDSKYLKEYYLSNNKNTDINNFELSLKLLDEDASFYFHEKNIFYNNKYKGRVLIGDKKNEESLMGLEKDLVQTNTELEIIKNRFVTILEKTQEGIYFNDITNGYIWFNDTLVLKLALNGNTVDCDEFYKMIHPDDLVLYQEKMVNITNDRPDFSVTYRFNTGTSYIYVKENGKKITNGKNVEFCGIMLPVDNYRFERTDTILDNIQYEPELHARFNMLIREERVFLVAHMKINSVPEINAKYGRSIGNLTISQYIEFFKDKFVNDNQIYRVSGLEFIAFITDYRKMDMLKNNLINGEKILHLEAEYLDEKITTNVFLGLSFSNDSPNPQDTLKNCQEALRFSTNPQFNSNFAYFKDIK